MKITHDLIAAVNGPGWKYGLSRILINDSGLGAVFIAGRDEPLAEFTVTSTTASRGTGQTTDGEVTWRRRGSSCSYKLAKCKVSTNEMTARWENSMSSTETEDSTPPAEQLTLDDVL